jgi:hypothetical protein
MTGFKDDGPGRAIDRDMDCPSMLKGRDKSSSSRFDIDWLEPKLFKFETAAGFDGSENSILSPVDPARWAWAVKPNTMAAVIVAKSLQPETGRFICDF